MGCPLTPPSQTRADRVGDHRDLWLPGPGLVAVDRFNRPGHLQNLLRVAVAIVRWFCVYAYRKSLFGMKRRPRVFARCLPDVARAGRSRRSSHPTIPYWLEYNAYLAELAKDDARAEQMTAPETPAAQHAVSFRHRRREDSHRFVDHGVDDGPRSSHCATRSWSYVVKVDNPPTWIGVAHGWVYFTGLLLTLNLAIQSAGRRQNSRVFCSPAHLRCSARRRALPDQRDQGPLRA